MQGALSQSDVITFHTLLLKEAEDCEDTGLQAHYEHALLSLQKIIESFGPTPEYNSWLVQFLPLNLAKQQTLFIDL